MPKNEYLALEQKLNEVLIDNADLKRENMIMKNEMAAMRNALSALKMNHPNILEKIQDLQNLRSIKPLLEISVLQQSVKSNSDRIQFLSVHEQARRQDFLALYNMTTDSSRRLTELETNTSGQILQHQTYTNNQLMNLQTTYNASLKGIREAMNGDKGT
ncbi:unnamed protein product [Mytilus edulis]|uniref:Uncharacterized protein n=1 Tax=Mytilus edulis TaxID=6550 RepID=A0A8S3UPJ7_MYTED|nr:unnamed protein product [Mytilus edulis]